LGLTRNSTSEGHALGLGFSAQTPVQRAFVVKPPVSSPGGLNSCSVMGGIRILPEEAFQHTLSLERKRAERSRRAFLLVLLDLTALQPEYGRDEVLAKIEGTLSKLFRETDVIGWQKNQTVLGIMFTEISFDDRQSVIGAILSRVSGVLYNNLAFDQFNQISISHYTFPEEWDHDLPHRPSTPTLYPDLEKRDITTKSYLVTKRAIDIVVSAIALVGLAPIFLAIAVATKLTSKGPVLFRQKRIGQFGTPFIFLKFRSMYLNNDSKIHERYVRELISGKAVRQPSTDKRNGNGNGNGVYKLTTDPRITRLGAFLRKSSLDELPQLVNVLRGEMSLVGPRPAIPYEVEAYEIWHRRRVLEAKPGITGLWQVSGRSRVGFDEMVRLDVRYAAKRSLWLDLKILLMTPRAVILGDGAY